MANIKSVVGEGKAAGSREYCSMLNQAESLWGTADTVDVWLCLEYRPAWQARALADNALAETTRNWLSSTVEALRNAGLKARPQFARQPQVDRVDTRLLVAFDDRCFEFSGQGYGFLDQLDLGACFAQREPTVALANLGRELLEPQYFVCTNGQRDLCCARYGRPLYTALTERVGERAWQVTHLGGHRFAPNLLTLPDGCLYGRVNPDDVDDFLEATEAGELDFRRLRGRTRYPAVVQAAEACLGRQRLRLLHCDGDETAATVQFADGSERLTVRMRRSTEGALVLKSCADEDFAEVFSYVQA